MNPDIKMTLWNMIKKYKLEKDDEKELQIVKKTWNSAQQFRKMNNMQRIVD